MNSAEAFRINDELRDLAVLAPGFVHAHFTTFYEEGGSRGR